MLRRNIVKNATIGCAFILLCVSLAWAQAVPSPDSSQCLFPSADYDDESSPYNLHGRITGVAQGYIEVQESRSEIKLQVKFDENTAFMSAFGGDYLASDFREGQIVWIWFINCDDVNMKDAAASIQIFSLDPKDLPEDPDDIP